MNSNKTQGFLLLLIFVWLSTFFLNPDFASEYNQKNLIRYCSMFALIGIAVLFVIVTGGIDLSIGSTVGFVGASLVLLLRLNPVDSLKPLGESTEANVVWFFLTLVRIMLLSNLAWLIWACFKEKFRIRRIVFPVLFLAIAILSYIGFLVANSDLPNTTRTPWIIALLIFISMHIGLLNGILITHFQLQPFVVTLSGLLCFRGLIIWLTKRNTQGLGSTFEGSLDLVAKGQICSVSTLMMFAGGGAAAFFLLRLLNRSVQNEKIWRGNVVGLSIGLIAGIIGSSRFWDGFEVKDFTYLFNFRLLGIPVCFPMWNTVLPEEAIARPQYLMKSCWVLLLPAILLTLTFLFINVWRKRDQHKVLFYPTWTLLDLFWMPERRKRNGIWNAIIVIAGLALSLIALYQSHRITTGEWVLNVSDDRLWRIRTYSMFGALALVMMAVSRLGRCIQEHGDLWAKLLFPISGLFAILSILGHSELPITMVQFPFFATAAIALLALVVIDRTVFGRYLLAIGNNEDAARYSGINTQEITVAAYVICSGIVGVAAIIFMIAGNSVSPTGFGSFYELYAIAAVVLGGCSLRGGEANVIGVLLGAAIMRVLGNAPDMIGFPKELEFTILGLVILIGVIVDEQIRRSSARKALQQNVAQNESSSEEPSDKDKSDGSKSEADSNPWS